MTSLPRNREAGTAIVESAFTLLTLFVVLFGIMEAGRFFQVQQMLTNAARESARYAATPLTQTSTMPTSGEVTTFAQKFTDAATIKNVTVSLELRKLSDGTATTSPCTVPCGKWVKVSAPYQIITISMFSSLSFTLKGEALVRSELSP